MVLQNHQKKQIFPIVDCTEAKNTYIDIVNSYELDTPPSLEETIDDGSQEIIEFLDSSFDDNEVDLDCINLPPKDKRISEDIKIAEFYDLTCNKCEIETRFATLLTYIKHLKNAHSVISAGVHCGLCNKKICHKFAALEHIEYHTNPDAFRCQECNKRFTQRFLMRLHMAKAHEIKNSLKYMCEYCPEQFQYSALLKRHLKIQHIERLQVPEMIFKFYCDLCPAKIFNSKRMVRYHMQSHISSKGYICEICSKCFTSRDNLKIHLNTVHAENADSLKRICPHCRKYFKNKHCLQNHINALHGKTGFMCDLCGQSCKSKAVLTEHMKRIHIKIKGYRCSKCKALFKNHRLLQEHQSVHDGTYKYSCPYCTKQFKAGSNYYSHRKKMHTFQWAQTKGIEVFNIVNSSRVANAEMET